MKSLFSPKNVGRITGLSYRQIQYWDTSGFIKPSYKRRGRFRLYTFSDLVQLEIASILRKHGLSIQRLRTVMKSLQGILPQLTFAVTDATMLFFHDGKILVVQGAFLSNILLDEDCVQFQVSVLQDKINVAFPEDVAVVSNQLRSEGPQCPSP